MKVRYVFVLIILFFCSITGYQSFGQRFIPHTDAQPGRKSEVDLINYRIRMREINSDTAGIAEKIQEIQQTIKMKHDYLKELRKNNLANNINSDDSLSTAAALNLAQSKSDSLSREKAKKVDTLKNSTPPTISLQDSTQIEIIGLGGISDLQNFEKAGGNAAFGMAIHFGKNRRDISKKLCKNCGDVTCRKCFDNCWHDNKSICISVDTVECNGEKKPYYYKSQLYQRNTVYAYWNTRTGSSSDTQILAKTFLFPEISKRDLTIGYKRGFSLRRNSTSPDWTFDPYFEVSTSHFDSGSSLFRVYSGIIGLTFDFSSQNGSSNFGLSFTPYYNVLSVDPKYYVTFDSAFHNPKLPPTFHTIGLNVVGSLSSFQIFGNVKYVFNKDISNVDLSGLNVTIGVLVNTNIWKFNVPQK